MTKRSHSRMPPPVSGQPLPVRRGPRGAYDPFYVFEKIARDNGKPYKPPEPKAELRLLELLGTKAAVVVMGCLLAAVVVTLLVVVALKL
jgi:hypothetical protein